VTVVSAAAIEEGAGGVVRPLAGAGALGETHGGTGLTFSRDSAERRRFSGAGDEAGAGVGVGVGVATAPPPGWDPGASLAVLGFSAAPAGVGAAALVAFAPGAPDARLEAAPVASARLAANAERWRM
jgi:hypothetical protein